MTTHVDTECLELAKRFLHTTETTVNVEAWAEAIQHAIEDWFRAGCVFCELPVSGEEAVQTKAGIAHEECAERVYPFDYGDSKWAT